MAPMTFGRKCPQRSQPEHALVKNAREWAALRAGQTRLDPFKKAADHAANIFSYPPLSLWDAPNKCQEGTQSETAERRNAASALGAANSPRTSAEWLIVLAASRLRCETRCRVQPNRGCLRALVRNPLRHTTPGLLKFFFDPFPRAICERPRGGPAYAFRNQVVGIFCPPGRNGVHSRQRGSCLGIGAARQAPCWRRKGRHRRSRIDCAAAPSLPFTIGLFVVTYVASARGAWRPSDGSFLLTT